MMVKESGGKFYPLLKVDAHGYIICPFCNEMHRHGTGDGHRLPHCRQHVVTYPQVQVDGYLFYKTDGYYIEH